MLVVVEPMVAIRAALKDKPMIDGQEKLSFEIEGEQQPEFTKIVKGELERWSPFVKASGFSSEE